ncbi:MAG: TRAP transporter small permease subunit [Geminicoccaceae bacterium]|nr:TRAP transporter small permease subunit [Geminicoccaceae bacterium]MCS7268262.1 TRAP transporter small permease subunit [Geminicoccaceae bacterium]MDW8125126.1 TRAP transporter small permease subunit [Geminicoccaceae bacterium]MDW8340901.1 TRAP transporter small permease subunit [Geminicoccaceae bacterium]
MSAIAVAAGHPPVALVRIVRTIDRLTLSTGAIFCWLVVPLVGAMVYEVFARYLFNRPTIWAFDVSYMLYGSHFMLGAAYTLYRGGHIRTDIFYQNWSPRTKGIIDATLYVLFFFPGIALFFWMGLQEALHSFSIGETSDVSPWRPPIWPFKMVIPISLAFLFVQGISEFLKSAYAAVTGRTL